MPGKWFGGKQDEHDNQAGQIQHSKDRQNTDARKKARADKEENAKQKRTE